MPPLHALSLQPPHGNAFPPGACHVVITQLIISPLSSSPRLRRLNPFQQEAHESFVLVIVDSSILHRILPKSLSIVLVTASGLLRPPIHTGTHFDLAKVRTLRQLKINHGHPAAMIWRYKRTTFFLPFQKNPNITRL